jgi:hypothetical protein
MWSSLPDTTKVALIALCGVIISALFAWMNARKSLYVSAVTVERSKWINALRANIALFSGKLRTLSFQAETNKLDEQVRLTAVAEINGLISLIHLQINPFGEIEQNVATMLERMPSIAEKSDGSRLRNADKLLIAHCQWLLKSEWEKVKYEVRSPLISPWLWVKAQCYLRRYRKFSRCRGKIE